jgi:hypothetical protein
MEIETLETPKKQRNRTLTYNYCGLVLVDYIDGDILLLTDHDKTYTLYKTQNEEKSRREHKFFNPWLGRYKNIYYDGFYLDNLIYSVAGW